jgi:hypothetical protein
VESISWSLVWSVTWKSIGWSLVWSFTWKASADRWSEASRGKHQLIAGLKPHVESISWSLVWSLMWKASADRWSEASRGKHQLIAGLKAELHSLQIRLNSALLLAVRLLNLQVYHLEEKA